MKKFYVTMFALCASVSLFAQDAPFKKFFLGGTGGYYSRANEQLIDVSPNSNNPIFVRVKNKNNGYTIAPEFGYFIKENIALGIKLSYNYTGGDNINSSSFCAAAPFVRFIVPISKGRFSLYNDLGISAGYGRSVEEVYPSPNGHGYPADTKNLNLGAFYEPGLQFRLKNNINLLATPGNLFTYSYTQKKQQIHDHPARPKAPETTTAMHSVGINSDFFAFGSFRLGINLLF